MTAHALRINPDQTTRTLEKPGEAEKTNAHGRFSETRARLIRERHRTRA
jgi:hypothetical protein